MGSMTGISPYELGIQILQNCLSELLSVFPQLDTAFSALSYFPDPNLSDIGTDGSLIRFSPAYLIRQYMTDPAAVRRGYLHMLLHCLHLHPFVGKHSRLWDMAADIAAELVIERAAVPRLALPPSGVRTECFRILGGSQLSAERLYGMLEDRVFPFSFAEIDSAFRFDNHALWMQQPEHLAAEQKKWKSLAFGAGRGGSRAGRNAGSNIEVLQAFGQGTYDYRRFLQQFMVQREEVLLDIESFDQIFYHYGLEYYGNLPLIEPLEYQEVSRLEELVIAVDTSGSCSAETVQRFLNETYAIISRKENFFREMTVYLLQCDCIVQSTTVIRSADEWIERSGSITIQGRGGTDFTPVFRYVEDLRRRRELKDLKALLYFTDGDGVYPREPTDYQTAFVFLHKSDRMEQVPPWAVRLVLE